MDRPVAVRPRADRAQFAQTWKGRQQEERDDAVPLCIYCFTEPATEANDPYCSVVCAIDAGHS